MSQQPAATPALQQPRPVAAVLWASALVLVGLIVVQAGRLVDRPSTRAEAAMASFPLALLGGPGQGGGGSGGSVSRVGDYTVMTFNGGNDDVLAVLDGRGETLFLYRVRNMTQFEMLSKTSLPELFTGAKRLGPGRK